MDNDIANKYKYLFDIKEDDNRSLFFLIIMGDLLKKNLDLTMENMYSLSYMKNMRNNDEWIKFCMDLAFEDKILDSVLIDIKLFPIILKFFTVMKNDIDVTNNTKEWQNISKIIRRKNKIMEFTGIKPKPKYIQSNETKFNFNKIILQKLLKEMLIDIPEMDQIEMIIMNPIQKCYENGIVPPDQLNQDICENLSCLEYIENCSSTKNLNKCKKFISNDINLNKIIKEVQDMDVCKATGILIKFGFKYNNMKVACFESYLDWEKRTLDTLKIKGINKGLIKYIELLIEKVNPISELKRKINQSGGGIANILSHYSDKQPVIKNIIDKHILIEKKYNQSKYIMGRYNTMMKIFNNNEIFNRNNKYLYSNYYDKINYKYLLQQKILLNYIERTY